MEDQEKRDKSYEQDKGKEGVREEDKNETISSEETKSAHVQKSFAPHDKTS
jgi:hypothetical protein